MRQKHKHIIETKAYTYDATEVSKGNERTESALLLINDLEQNIKKRKKKKKRDLQETSDSRESRHIDARKLIVVLDETIERKR